MGTEGRRVTDAELRDAAVAALKATTISYPEWAKRVADGYKGKPYPPANTAWGQAFSALEQIGAAPPPDPEPSPQFGALLPPRLAPPSGTPQPLDSVAKIKAAFTNGGVYQAVDGVYDMGGATMQSFNPLYISAQPGQNVRWRNGYWLLRGKTWLRGPIVLDGGSAVKIEGPSDYSELDGLEICNSKGQGVLIGSGAPPSNWQLRNLYLHNNGSNGNLDHNIYASTSLGKCVIANCLGVDPWAYNFQLYPKCSGLIVTCCTMDGYTEQPQKRGGMVLGSEGSATTYDNTIVGLLGTNAPFSCIHINNPLGSGNKAFDSLGFGNGGSDFESATGITYTNCKHADPLYVNRATKDYHLRAGSPAIGLIQADRFGYVPAFDKDGKRRTTADAGCYAA